MNLLDITEFFSPVGGGVKTYLAAKAQWLAARPDVTHTIVIPGAQDRDTRLAGSRVIEVAGPPVPRSPGYHLLTNGRRVRAILNDVRPDVIEVGSPFLAAHWARCAARTLRPRPRLVGFYHCDVPRVYVDYGLRALPRFARRVMGNGLASYLRRVYTACDAVIAATPSAQRALERLGVPRVHLIPLGVDLETFRPEARDPAWRQEVGARPGQPVGIYAGRLAAEKRLDVVLEALPELHRATGFMLALMGEGHLRHRLEASQRAHPDMLRVLRYESDRAGLARALASADLYVAPFPMETFGLAAVEAMACGLPVVGVNAGAIADLLEGRAWGRLYRPGEAADLVKATGDLLNRDRQVLCARARAHATAHYSWERTFGQSLTLYDQRPSRMPKTPAPAPRPSPPPSPSSHWAGVAGS